MKYPYSDFPHFAEDNLKHFKSFLIYDPHLPMDDIRSTQLPIRASPKRSQKIWLELPPVYSLIAVSQLQINIVKGHGEVLVKTQKCSRDAQEIVIQQGVSFRKVLQEADCARLKQWREKVLHRWHAGDMLN